jgi:predicted DNA-binding transcriptional regulator AlpA
LILQKGKLVMGKKELTALEVGRLAKPGLHFVGGVTGLGLNISASGARSWILRVMVGGKRRDIGLGGFPTVLLGEAKVSARAARQKIRDGIDPVEERRAARTPAGEGGLKKYKFLKTTQAAAAFNIHRSSLWRWAQIGLMTPPVRLAERSTAWIEGDIDAIIAARVGGANDDEIRKLVVQLCAQRKGVAMAARVVD